MARKTPTDSSDETSRSWVRNRSFEQWRTPAQAENMRNAGNEDEVAIAVEIYNGSFNAQDGWRPYPNTTVDQTAPARFNAAVTAMQEDASAAAGPTDDACLSHADEAEKAARRATELMDQADGVLDQVVTGPSGERVTRRQAAVDHDRDVALAKQREADGDMRHRQWPVRRYVILLGAIAYGLIDLLLLYKRIFNLGSLDSSDDLLRWLLAVACAAVQALMLDLGLSWLASAERKADEQRTAIRDYNRRLVENPAAAGSRPPGDELAGADSRLKAAEAALVGLATLTGIVAAVRIAVLTRQGGMSAIESSLFSVTVGLVVFGVIVVLGRFVCRGNALGDSVRGGGEIVAETDALRQDGIEDVTAARDVAVAEIAHATRARAHGEEIRARIQSCYWEGIQLATSWMGLAEPPLKERSLLRRTQPVVGEADRRLASVSQTMARIGAWLSPQPDPSRPAIEAGPGPAAASMPSAAVATRSMGAVSSTTNFPRDAAMAFPTAPGTPMPLLVAGAVVTVVSALATALVWPAPASVVAAAQVLSAWVGLRSS